MTRVGGPRDWLRLVRAPFAPTAACDAVVCALLARGPGLSEGAAPLSVSDGLRLAATALLVYSAGMLGNDLADRERDRTINPDRPLPSGRVSVLAASSVLGLLVGLSFWPTILSGDGLWGTYAVASAVVAGGLYNRLHARWPLGSAPLMGLARFSNASLGVLPLVAAGRAHPLVLAAPAAIGVYSSAITVLSTGEDRPAAAPRRLVLARILAFGSFAAAGLLAIAGAQGATLGAFFAAPVCLSIAFGRVPRGGNPTRVQVREMMLGLYWLAAILATGAAYGSDWVVAVVAFPSAYALILLSQLAVRALARRP